MKLKHGLLALTLALAAIAVPLSQATVSNTNVRTVAALGNGVTTNYTIGFTFQSNSTVAVYLQDESTSPYTISRVLYGAGAGKFTITGGDPGTTVVMGTAPSSSQRIVIKRLIPLTQAVDYVETDAFPAEDHEEAMDKMTMLIQNMDYEISTKIGLSTVSAFSVPTFPDPVANKFVGYGSSTLGLFPATGTMVAGDVLRFSGSSWGLYDLDTALSTDAANLAVHIANVSNPHSVTAAQVGSATAQWNASKIQGTTVDASSIGNGKALTYDSGSGTIKYVTPGLASLNQNHIYVGDGASTATDVAMSGDASIVASGALTISSDAITSAKILDGTIVNADVATAAAIARTKVGTSTANYVVINDANGNLGQEQKLAVSRGGTGQDFGASTGVMKFSSGTATVASLVNADVDSAAAIARTKIGTSTANYVVINDANGKLGEEATLAVSRGGTGLATLTANNVILGNGTSTPAFVAPSTSGNVLTSNGTTWLSTTPASAPSASYDAVNASYTTINTANTMSIILKDSTGVDPSSGSPVKVGFRSSTATSGSYNQRSITTGLSVVVLSGASLGQQSAVAERTYFYLQDVAGSIQGCASSNGGWDEGTVVASSTLKTTSNSRSTLYCTTGALGPVRKMARVTATEAASGTWATAPSEVSAAPFQVSAQGCYIYDDTPAGFGSSGTMIRRIETNRANTCGNIITRATSSTNGNSYTINEPGMYSIFYQDEAPNFSSQKYGISVNATSTTTDISTLTYANGQRSFSRDASTNQPGGPATWIGPLYPGDIVRPHTNGSLDGTSVQEYFTIAKIGNL